MKKIHLKKLYKNCAGLLTKPIDCNIEMFVSEYYICKRLNLRNLLVLK